MRWTIRGTAPSAPNARPCASLTGQLICSGSSSRRGSAREGEIPAQRRQLRALLGVLRGQQLQSTPLLLGMHSVDQDHARDRGRMLVSKEAH
jgi:hypothetical protein